MNIKFKKNDWLFYLAIGQVGLGVIFLIVSFVLNGTLRSFATIFLPLAALILLLINRFVAFKDEKTPIILKIVALIASGLCLTISATSSESYGIDMVEYYYSLSSTAPQILSLMRFMDILIYVVGVVFHIFFILGLVAYLIFAFSSKEKKDVWNIVRVSNYGLLIPSLVLFILVIVAFFFRGAIDYLFVFNGLVNLLFASLIVFFIVKDTIYCGKQVAVSGNDELKNTSSVSVPSNMDEQTKIELLRKYKDLLDRGVITQEEFEKKKAEILK